MNDFPATHGFGRLIGKSSSACCVSAHDGSTVRVLQVIITLLIDDPGRTQEAGRGYVGTTYTMANGSCGEPMTIDRLLHVLRENVVDARLAVRVRVARSRVGFDAERGKGISVVRQILRVLVFDNPLLDSERR